MSPSLVNKPSFKLRSISYKETLQEVKRIRNDRSTGNDNISISLVKLVSENIASPLTYIINEGIRLFVFPTEWKCIRISVIPKIDNPTTGGFIQSIWETNHEAVILFYIIYDFIETNNIYSSTQAGYRRNHSGNTISGVNFDENLIWENHKVIKTCYSTLTSLRKMKRFTDFKLQN